MDFNAEIISVGSELLLGQILNTNAQFLSKELALLGINVYHHTAVGDNAYRMKNVIQNAQERANFIILTGGLGPTKDDVTKQTLAKLLQAELVYDKDALTKIMNYFKKANRTMTENNRKQALVIKGAHVLENKTGMAPGMVYVHNEIIYILLPGPPHELQPMFLNEVKPFLHKQGYLSHFIISRVLRFYGIGESQLESELEDLIENQTNPTIAPLATRGEVTIRLTARGKTEKEVNELLDKEEKKVLERTGRYFYGYDSTSLPLEVSKLLEQKNLRIASAESLTGGLFSQLLTKVSGAGSIFNGGIVSYTDEVKENILQVPRDILQRDGAVSSNCALKMAENVRDLLQADIGISFTGVAGPSKSENKEIGTVFIGLAFKKEPTVVYPLNLVGSRDTIRKSSANYGFYYLLKHLKKGE
ncbi:competence/damage-inducible protein A [Pueribacillus sp. YX66]|uniref:competence/damage-inducible protein A n=1 Tax=Pueribacillus sp. YX66 TaxID=3229242 RepID=UPI00358D54AE